MQIQVFKTKEELGKAAAERAAEGIREAIDERQQAYVIAATGASQFELLDSLVVQPGIDWSKTTFFHLDEYVGLPESHPASFRRYLKERIVERIHPGEFFFIDGDHPDPDAECRRVGNLISQHTIDIALVGIGENGHLAFNDPPADFETEDPYLVVELDEVCRRQQLGEGWFKSLAEVPGKAISMSVQQVLKARQILCSVPDKRKAEAVRDCLEKEISPQFPASILRRHPGTVLFLDEDSTSLLKEGGPCL
ncbi:glucosamine-6-phosphate deaminase [Acidobacteria bacterium AH-259-G07]|nr:glucosamine-6-phosphate deaminase [Acidobacteria bacterium AH-259-G07]